MSKLKVLCCSGSLEGGGSERQLLQLANSLPEREFEVGIFLQHHRGALLSEVPQRVPVYSSDSAETPAEVKSWAYSRNLPGGNSRAQVNYLSQLVARSSYQVIYDRTYHATLLTSVVARKTSTARVSVIVSPPSRDFGQSKERFYWLKKRLLRKAYSDPRAITLAVSGATAKDTAKFYRIPLAKIEVVPSPVDRQRIQRLAEAKAEASGNSDHSAGAKRIVCVGRMSAEKGQADLIEALALLVRQAPQFNWRLTLVGDGPDAEKLRSIARELGLDDRVEFLGFQANPHPWIKAADCLCIPSRYEGLPNVALEAMVHETPVVATKSSDALIDLLGSAGERGYLAAAPHSAAHIADAILRRFTDDTAHVQAKIVAAGSWVDRQHGLAPWLERMQVILREAVRKRGA